MPKFETEHFNLEPGKGKSAYQESHKNNKQKVYKPHLPGHLKDERSKIVRDIIFNRKSVESVIYEDTRKIVADTTTYPFSAICSLDSYWDQKGFITRGTGAMIGPDIVLTCAHNVYDYIRTRRVMDMEVFPGRQGETSPFNSTAVKDIFFPKEWQESRDWDADIALLKLAEPLGDKTGGFGLVSDEDEEIKKMKISATGYSGDLDPTARTQYYNESNIYDLTDTSLFYQADTFRGNSGSAVYTFLNGLENGAYITAVHTNGDDHWTPGFSNRGRRLDNDTIDQILEWIDAANKV